MTYGFFTHCLFNLLAAFPTPNALTACADAADAISFALLNRKMTYNHKHQLLFINVEE